jgi:hypothetical protein
MGEMRNAYTILVENLKGRDYLEDLDIDGRIILNSIKLDRENVDWNRHIFSSHANSLAASVSLSYMANNACLHGPG